MECSTQRDSGLVATKSLEEEAQLWIESRVLKETLERAVAPVMSVAMEMKDVCPARWGCRLSRRFGSSKIILSYTMKKKNRMF